VLDLITFLRVQNFEKEVISIPFVMKFPDFAAVKIFRTFRRIGRSKINFLELFQKVCFGL